MSPQAASPPRLQTGATHHRPPTSARVYNGTLTFAVSPDTPHKAVHDEPNQTYGTTGGGILAAVTLQVVGNEQGHRSLFMDLDDGNPNPPGSNVTVFTSTGSVT